MYGALDTSTSGLVAQRTRLAVISANIANSKTIENAQGQYDPYRRRIAFLSAGDPASGKEMGVHVREVGLDDAPFRKQLEPGNPYADADGYVEYPNIDSTTEQIDAMEAVRAYEANIVAAEATRSMLQQGLRLIA